MTDYAEIAADVRDLLTDEGQIVTLRTVTAGEYDPATSGAADVTTDTTRRAVLFDIGRGVESIRGQLVQATDRQAYMDANGAAPATGDTVIDSNEASYSVVSSGVIAPTGTVVLYDVHLRA